MKLSALIAHLQGALRRHGDLEVFTSDADIAEVILHPCTDGVQRTVDGIPDDPNELVIEFASAR